MKTKSLFAIAIGLMLFCIACNKASNYSILKTVKETKLDTAYAVTPATASIIAKWTEVKQRIQTLNASTGAIMDTTYQSGDFTTGDYFQFKSDSTAIFEQTAVRTTNGIITSNGMIAPQQYSYKVSGSNLKLTYLYPQSVPSNVSGGPFYDVIVQLDINALYLHSISQTLDGSSTTVIDTYFIRAK